MATKKAPDERATDPTWLEIRDQGTGGFGSVIRETQVTVAPTAPSPEAIQVPDGTPEHPWEPWPAALIPGVSRQDLTAPGALLGYPKVPEE